MDKFISRILKYGTLISTYLLIGSVLLQIFARFFLEKAPAWTEEASRLFFIYAIAFAAGLALKSRYYVALDLFYEKLSLQNRKRLDLLVPLSVAILFGLMAIYALPFIIEGHKETSPSMNMPMSWAFLSMFIMAGSVVYFAIKQSFKAFNKLKS